MFQVREKHKRHVRLEATVGIGAHQAVPHLDAACYPLFGPGLLPARGQARGRLAAWSEGKRTHSTGQAATMLLMSQDDPIVPALTPTPGPGVGPSAVCSFMNRGT